MLSSLVFYQLFCSETTIYIAKVISVLNHRSTEQEELV